MNPAVLITIPLTLAFVVGVRMLVASRMRFYCTECRRLIDPDEKDHDRTKHPAQFADRRIGEHHIGWKMRNHTPHISLNTLLIITALSLTPLWIYAAFR